jgi:hypothetical protein
MAQSVSGREKADLSSPAEAEQDPPNVRAAKIAAIVLGILLVASFIAVFAVIGYRLAHPRPQASSM